MKFSIIVCTYNRAAILDECLKALTKQSISSDQFEVIIVNNNSSDHTAEVAQKYIAENSNFRLVTELKQGLSNARNLGFAVANAEWVGYIDDDAKARPNYIERIFEVIEKWDFDCFGGIDVPWYKNEKPFWYKDSYFGSRLNYDNISLVKDDEYITGFSMNFKKDLLEKAKGFSPELGMTGDKIAYSEEIDIQLRMRDMGPLKVGYDPALVVDHLVQDYKLDLDWFFISSFALGRDNLVMGRMNTSIFGLIMISLTSLIFTFWRLIYYTPKLLRRDYFVQNWLKDIFRKTAKRIGIVYTVLKQRGKE